MDDIRLADRSTITKIVFYSLLGTGLVVLWVGLFLQNASDRPIGFETIYAPHEDSRVAEIFREDFSDWVFVDSVGKKHDGTQFYVMARHLSPTSEATQLLDHPQYRWQRPLYPMLARLLYPPGEGTGLLVAFTAISLGSVLVAAVALGLLSVSWGGSPKVAFWYPLLPGVLMTLRWGLADTLALAFLAVAAYALTKRKILSAIILLVAACFTKETSLIVALGLSIWVLFDKQEKQGLQWRKASSIFLVPAALTTVWWMYIRASVDTYGSAVKAIVIPFKGAVDSFNHWSQQGNFGLTVLVWAAGLLLAVWAFKRNGFTHPFSWVVLLNTVFFIFLDWQVIGLSANVARMLLPSMAFALVMISSKTSPQIPYSMAAIKESLTRRIDRETRS